MLGATRTDTHARDGLKDAWADLLQARPRLRQRDAAELLGVSEGELVACRQGSDIVALATDWPQLLKSLAPLGRVKTITRNAYAVHETVGVYEKLSFVGNVALVQSAGLDLRLLLDRWAAGFSVREKSGTTLRHSLQFYDREGVAIHKIYVEDESGLSAFADIVNRFSDRTSRTIPLAREDRGNPPAVPSAPSPECKAALLEDWAGLRDTHDFAAMLGRHRLERPVALQLAEGVFTTSLPVSGLHELLESVARAGVPLMVFVGNSGAVQIHTGPITTVKRLGPWLNILDDAFNLHLLEENVERAWVVLKPTTDGVVTSVEAYAGDGSEIVVFYGARKPGVPELSSWRDVVAGLTAEEAALNASADAVMSASVEAGTSAFPEASASASAEASE